MIELQFISIYLEGKWKNNHDNVELQSDAGRIILLYSSKSVNVAAGGTGQGVVYEGNSSLSNYSKGVDTTNKDSKFVIDYPRLYNIVNHQSYGDEDFHSIVYSDITLYSLFKYCKADYHKKIAIISLGGELYGH